MSLVIKPFILKRDQYECQLCKTNRKLKIHHILPIKKDSTDTNILTPINLVNLCEKGHLKAHDGCTRRIDAGLEKILLALVKNKEINNTTVVPIFQV